MKLEETLEKNEVQQIKDSESEDIEFGIDKEDEWIIFKSFTNYSDPIGAIVREIASNAFDAHVEAEVDRDIEITIHDEDDLMGKSSLISFRDFGEGMSPEIIKTIYSRFGKSTKRDRNDAIGAFGFGAKSPLAYQDMFDLITINEGIRYHYSVHAGEQRPIITLLDKGETDEPSGTEVRINIKEGDKKKFIEALERSLKYFEGVKYENCGISNDYKIFKGEHFIYREDTSDHYGTRQLHICLGKVRYPIDSNIINHKNIDVGLYFDIGEIPVVWNRENIEYTEKATKKIQEKVHKVEEELQNLYDSYFDDVDSIEKLLKFKSSSRTIPIYYDDDGNPVGVEDRSGFISKETKYRKYKRLKVKPSSSLFDLVKIDKMKSKYGNYMSSSFRNIDMDSENIYIMDKGMNYSELKTEYIVEKEGDSYFLRFENKKQSIRQFMNVFFTTAFTRNPYDFEKKVRQEVIKEARELYEEVKQYILNKGTKYADVTVSEQFEKDYLAAKEAEKKRKEEIFHFLRVSRKGSFSRTRINGNTLKNKFKDDTVIYGFQDDRRTLKEVKQIISNEYSWEARDHIHLIQISMRNERVVKEVLGDKAYYVHKVKQVPALQRLSNKYNKKAWMNKLMADGIDIPKKSHFYLPSYITPEEPTNEEKKEVYEVIGKHKKYPLLRYIKSIAPDELIQEYKETCKYHHVNPILIGKKHIKEHYENQRTEEQQ